MADFPRYEPASPRCSGVAQPGVVAFMQWAVKDYGRGAFNLGIYNCRTVRGSTNRSMHGDGRAGDVGFPGVSNRAGTDLVNLLLPHVRELGIQLIIWDRKIWSAKAPNGARYQGTVPHTDHIHAEFTWNAARTLTRDRVRVVVGGRLPAAETPAPQPVPPPYIPPVIQQEDDMDAILRCPGKGVMHIVGGLANTLETAEVPLVEQSYTKQGLKVYKAEISQRRWAQLERQMD